MKMKDGRKCTDTGKKEQKEEVIEVTNNIIQLGDNKN